MGAGVEFGGFRSAKPDSSPRPAAQSRDRRYLSTRRPAACLKAAAGRVPGPAGAFALYGALPNPYPVRRGEGLHAGLLGNRTETSTKRAEFSLPPLLLTVVIFHLLRRRELWMIYCAISPQGQANDSVLITQNATLETRRFIEKTVYNGISQIYAHHPGCSLTSTGCLLSLASNSRHWCSHTRQSRDQPPAYIQQLIRPYTPTRPLRSATSGRLAPPARHTCTARSRLLSVLAPRWWNDLPVDVRTAETLSTFNTQTENPPLQTASLPPLPHK